MFNKVEKESEEEEVDDEQWDKEGAKEIKSEEVGDACGITEIEVEIGEVSGTIGIV